MNTLYTVGHSNHSIEHFISLLTKNDINVIVDVRSTPYSKFCPHFNRLDLKLSLAKSNISYLLFDKEFGARREEDCCYENNQVSYNLVAQTDSFKKGIDRIKKGIEDHRISLMCSEKDPITCHRFVMICKVLKEDMDIAHILSDGELEPHSYAESRLMQKFKIPENNLFQDKDELLEEAYQKQESKIAYRR